MLAKWTLHWVKISEITPHTYKKRSDVKHYKEKVNDIATHACDKMDLYKILVFIIFLS